MLKVFNDETFIVLKKALDGASLRHQVLAHNIANVDTPRYKRLDVDFKHQLRLALDKTAFRGITTRPRHIPIGPPRLADVKPRVFREEDTSMRNDKNNVDIDREMAELYKNSMYYVITARLISSRYQKLEMVMR